MTGHKILICFSLVATMTEILLIECAEPILTIEDWKFFTTAKFQFARLWCECMFKGNIEMEIKGFPMNLSDGKHEIAHKCQEKIKRDADEYSTLTVSGIILDKYIHCDNSDGKHKILLPKRPDEPFSIPMPLWIWIALGVSCIILWIGAKAYYAHWKYTPHVRSGPVTKHDTVVEHTPRNRRYTP